MKKHVRRLVLISAAALLTSSMMAFFIGFYVEELAVLVAWTIPSLIAGAGLLAHGLCN